MTTRWQLKLEEFWGLVDEAKMSDVCFEFKHSQTNRGYSRLTIRCKQIYAHRLVLERAIGRPIKEGYGALHRCNNTACINENHIYEGTAHDNRLDFFRNKG